MGHNGPFSIAMVKLLEAKTWLRPLNHLPMDLAWPRPPGPGGIGDETLLMARNLVEAAVCLGRWERQRTTIQWLHTKRWD